MLADANPTSLAKMIVDAGGWTACVALVMFFAWVVFKKRVLIQASELLNEQAERAREAAAWEKRLADERAQCAEEQKVWRERYDELKAESIERMGNLRTEKDMWRAIALKAANVAEVATDKAASAGGG